jgi:hypothetical protein
MLTPESFNHARLPQVGSDFFLLFLCASVVQAFDFDYF